MKEEQTFYVVQKAIIKKGNEVLVLNDPIEGLDFPGGKMQEGEGNIMESLKREVREETELEISVGNPFYCLIETFPQNHRYAGKKAYVICYRCEYVSGDVKLSHEHNNFKWVTIENCKSVDDGTSYYRILEKYFE
jgi:8-oxo-dGTP pyrophosphatase MutT (NUDIX family)